MTIKLAYLKTGEYVISDVLQATETTDGKKNILCYVLNNPRAILAQSAFQEQGLSELKVNVRLITWPQFTKSNIIEMLPEAFIAFADPTDELLNLYKESVNV